MAIIIFAVVIKLVLLPFSLNGKKSTLRMTRMSARTKELEKRYAGNQQKYQEEVSKLYKDEGINPLSGCIWALIPIPILIVLLGIVRMPVTQLMGVSEAEYLLIQEKLVAIGALVMPENPGNYFQMQVADLISRHFDEIQAIVPSVMRLNFHFLGMDLAAVPQWNFFMSANWSEPREWLPQFFMFLIPLVSALLTHLQLKLSQANSPTAADPTNPANNMTNSMNFMMPVMSIGVGYTLPTAMGLYWLVGYLWSLPQEILSNRYYGKMMEKEDEERGERFRQKDVEYEQRREETERLRAEGLTERNKSTSRRKRQLAERAKEEERIAAERKEGREVVVSPSREGNRKYARGRAYIPDRFTNPIYEDGAPDIVNDDDDLFEDDDGEFDDEILQLDEAETEEVVEEEVEE